MKLTCDLCGGTLQMNAGGKGAACAGCGMTYSMDALREKLGAAGSGSGVPVSAAAAPVMRLLRIRRKPSLTIFKAAVLLDGKIAGMLGGAGSVTAFELPEGLHTISFQVASGAGLTETDAMTFTVADRDLSGVFYLKRNAFSAQWRFEFE